MRLSKLVAIASFTFLLMLGCSNITRMKNDSSSSPSTSRGCVDSFIPLEKGYDLGASKPIECMQIINYKQSAIQLSFSEKDPKIWPRIFIPIIEYTTTSNLPVVGKEYLAVPASILSTSGDAVIPEISGTDIFFTEIASIEGQLTKGHITIHQPNKSTFIEFAIPTVFRKAD